MLANCGCNDKMICMKEILNVEPDSKHFAGMMEWQT
jgi:hypothetical protein